EYRHRLSICGGSGRPAARPGGRAGPAQVDLIVASAGGQGRGAAQDAPQAIPPVPIALRAARCPRPTPGPPRPRGGGAAVSGSAGLEWVAKQLELLMLTNPGNPSHDAIWKETERAARLLRVELMPVEVRDSGDFEAAFAAMRRARAEAFIHAPDEFFFTQR